MKYEVHIYINMHNLYTIRYTGVLRLPWFTKSLQDQVRVYVDGLPEEEQRGAHNEHWMIQPCLVVLLEVCQPSSLHVAVEGAEQECKEDDV